MRGFSGKRFLVVFMAALAMCLWAQTGVVLAQPATEKPVVKKAAPAKVEKRAGEKAKPASVSSKPVIPPAIETEIQSRVNEVRKEVLDYRADNIGWWLAFIAIVFTVLGVVLAAVGLVGGYIGFNIFRDLRSDAQKSVDATNQHLEDAKRNNEEAKGLVEEIKRYRDETKAIRDETAESAADEPDRVRRVAEDTRKNPQASPMDKAIANAISLQQEHKFDEAIEAWRKIANVMEGVDDALAANAWFSVGYLLGEEGKDQEAIDAYNQSICLEPRLADAYNNRGATKGNLGRDKDAIADFDQAIRLNPDLADAYANRGNAKHNLSQYVAAVADYDDALRLEPEYAEAYSGRGLVKASLRQFTDAIKDFNEAIRLKPNYAEAYLGRGIVKTALGLKDEAREDLMPALELARVEGNEKLAARAEQDLQKLDAQ